MNLPLEEYNFIFFLENKNKPRNNHLESTIHKTKKKHSLQRSFLSGYRQNFLWYLRDISQLGIVCLLCHQNS